MNFVRVLATVAAVVLLMLAAGSVLADTSSGRETIAPIHMPTVTPDPHP